MHKETILNLTATIAADEKTYTEAVNRGDYDLYVGNLFGKYDNVRVYWEDQLTRLKLRPWVTQVAAEKRQRGQGIRVVDLGCGAGQGYDVLTKIDKRDLDLSLNHERVLSEEDIEVYLGLDLSHAMVDKGNELFADTENVRFAQADLREGLAAMPRDEASFDIYFSSYGSFSHLSRAALKSLLLDISQHARNGSLIVLDLLGRYSIEWPCYWSPNDDHEEFHDYSMSYLVTEFGMSGKADHFPMRFWTGQEVESLVKEVQLESAGQMVLREKFDRSIMVGRHVDTQEYNANLPPLRRMVNRLHEDYMRTDLHELLVERQMIPPHTDPQVNKFFDELFQSWNLLIEFCDKRLQTDTALVDLSNWEECSGPLQFAMMTMDRVINDTGWLWNGDPRANIIESQLGYTLRNLEASLQQELGCGHGLVAILQVQK